MPAVTRLRSINPFQAAIVGGVLYALVGLVIAIFFLPFGDMMTMMVPHNAFAGLGAFSLIIFPIGYGILGFISWLVVAAIYILVARWTGGIEVTFEDVTSGATLVRSTSA